MRIEVIVIILLVLITFGITGAFYGSLPDKMASHWNATGKVDGWMQKSTALLIIPITILVLSILFFILPLIDPLKKNIEKFKTIYYGFIIVFQLFMLLVQIHIILWNKGTKINPLVMFSVGISVLFLYMGYMMDKLKRNWFIGIRTPWTLSSDIVWDKTHKQGALLFKICGFLVLPGIFLPNIAIYLIMAPILLSSAYLIIYSYLEFKKLPESDKKQDDGKSDGEE